MTHQRQHVGDRPAKAPYYCGDLMRGGNSRARIGVWSAFGRSLAEYELGDFTSLLQPGGKRVCECRLACAGGAKEFEDHVLPARRC